MFTKVNPRINVSLDKLCSRSFECVCVCVCVGGPVIVSIDSGLTGEPVPFSTVSYFQGADLLSNRETLKSIQLVASLQLFSTDTTFGNVFLGPVVLRMPVDSGLHRNLNYRSALSKCNFNY